MFCHLCNKVLDIDNLVSVFYLFLFSVLKSFGHEKMSFSEVNIVFSVRESLLLARITHHL